MTDELAIGISLSEKLSSTSLLKTRIIKKKKKKDKKNNEI